VAVGVRVPRLEQAGEQAPAQRVEACAAHEGVRSAEGCGVPRAGSPHDISDLWQTSTVALGSTLVRRAPTSAGRTPLGNRQLS
jgi:hypothetical protein